MNQFLKSKYWLTSFLTFSLLLSLPCHALTVQKQFDDPVVVTVSSKKPTFVIKLPSNSHYLWFLGKHPDILELYTHQSKNDEEIWTFNLQPSAFIAPRVINFSFLFGNPGSDSDNEFEEQQVIIKTVK